MPLIVLAALGIVGLLLLVWLRSSRDAREADARKPVSSAKLPKS